LLQKLGPLITSRVPLSVAMLLNAGEIWHPFSWWYPAILAAN